MAREKVPTRNYIIVIGTIIFILCACLAAFNIYNAIKENNIKTSPLSTKEVLYTDFKTNTIEMDADTFFVISYTQDEDVHKNEKAIKKLLNNKNLLNNVLYLDVTEYKDVEDVLEVVNKTLNLDDRLKINKLPAVVYYKDNTPTAKKDSKDHLLDVGDFDSIIEEYQLAS